ncbi:hypothetical protein [Bacillus sp. NPDC094106]|uniref:hypothetical protein n=1 Tax=Bacillus sp. NPDC094106 TaxID=3363949 RepID=UPI0037F30567
MSFLVKVIICYAIVVVLSFIIMIIEVAITKSEFPGTMLIFIGLVVSGPFFIPTMNNAYKIDVMEEKVVSIFGKDIKKEYVSGNKLIVSNKEGTYEITYNDDKNIELIKSITKDKEKEEEQRAKTKEILKNI